MVPNLVVYKSHPNKLLEVHIKGVVSKTIKRTHSKIAELSAIFHDLGKMNLNFQRKLVGSENVGYSQHSYISAFAFLNWYVNNREYANKILGCTNHDITKVKIISTIILHHHGNLPNMDQSLSVRAFEEMLIFLEKNSDDLPISKFLAQNMKFEHCPFDLSIKGWYKSKIPNIDLGKDGRMQDIEYWQQDALGHFLETQFSFASLIESDKRDAGNIETFNYDTLLQCINTKLYQSLDYIFANLNSSVSNKELNQVRTEIRKEATSNISHLLKKGQRVFTLTAPTGAGKTFTLLDIARNIQKVDPNLGIIFALPYLSITDQIEQIIREVLNIDVLSINSKSINVRIEKVQAKLEEEQNTETLNELLLEDFIQATFDHPFIITTFVQLFETLLSNHNSTLLKLPNFANRIFLIDEIQALPPRLYIFFSAWLEEFCRRHNSYVILSTATMPNLIMFDKPEIKNNQTYNLKSPQLFFKKYQIPKELLSPQKYFENNVFNRYQIKVKDEDYTIERLAVEIKQTQQSILIILNTIQDTKDLFEQLADLPNTFLLNTHFTPQDRLAKIEDVKQLLQVEKVILISTQLIEAGVDIDFPIVYRDLCPLPSLIQSAGRCNRNKKYDFGTVYLIQLLNRNNKYSSELIYRNDAKLFLDFIRQNIRGQIEEKQLFQIQREFFEAISKNLEIGSYPEESMNLIQEINRAQFESVGKFQLIYNKTYGTQYQFFVPESEDDFRFEELANLIAETKESEYAFFRKQKIKIENKLKSMSNRIISVRFYNKSEIPPLSNSSEVCGIYKLDMEYYCKTRGITISTENQFL